MRSLILCLLIGFILALQTGCSTTPTSKDGPMGFPGQNNPDAIPDASPRDEPLSRYGNPKHYEVYGKRYYVKKSSKDFKQEGIASWYGKQFHGRRTSSGEPYDMFKMTAAHKTLPIPTYVKVTNEYNGRSIVVRVNDRGPFHSNRVIDLSYAAALKLGIADTGTAPVSIEALNTLNPAPAPALTPAEITREQQHRNQAQFVQIGVFAQIDNAKRLQDRILHSSLPTPEIMTVTINDADLYRVVIGPVDSDEHLEEVGYQLEEMGIPYRTVLSPAISQ